VLSEYAKAPGVTRDRLYIDMMQSVLGNTTKVLIDQKAGGNLLYLPLDKLIQQSVAAAAAVATDVQSSATRAATAPPPEPAVTLDPSRSREGMRSRER
jgi:modulator of FtsH protease HflK